MSETLLVHYDINLPQQAVWSLCNSQGELTGKICNGTLDQLAEAAEQHPVIILLNSQCLHINELQFPTQNLQKVLKAVPYAIEEFIAEDIEEMHFVVTRTEQNRFAVVGIKKATLDGILRIFDTAGINIETIIPDALCLPADNSGQQWACLNYLETSYLQTDRYNGLLLQHSLLPAVLQSKLTRSDESKTLPEKILLFSEDANSDAFEELINTQSIDSEQTEVINIVYNQHPLVIFCNNFKQALPLNLLQHDFKIKRKSTGYLQHWRIAAALGLTWILLYLGQSTITLKRLEKDNKTTQAAIEKIYKKTFPQSRKIVNPRVQMEQKLKELKSNTGNMNKGLLFLLSESFGTAGLDKSRVSIQSLTFRNNRMEAILNSDNLQAIENLNNKLNQSKKIKSQITSSSSEKDRVKGSLRIESRS